MLLCRHHHTLLHEGGYTLRRRRGGRVAFFRPDGRRVPEAPRARGGHAPALAGHSPPITPDTAVTGWQGDRLDLPLATHLLAETRLRL